MELAEFINPHEFCSFPLDFSALVSKSDGFNSAVLKWVRSRLARQKHIKVDLKCIKIA